MRVAGPADRRPILFEHHFEYLQARADGPLEHNSASVSTKSSTRGRRRVVGDSGAGVGRSVRDFFTAAPLL